MRIKSNIFIIFSLIFIFLFTGCFGLKYKPRISVSRGYSKIYKILKNDNVNYEKIARENVYKVENIFGRRYGISFNDSYTDISAFKVYNDDYNDEKDFGKEQYIKFYDDIKVIIGEKEYIIPKEEIVLNDLNKDMPSYSYPAPIDIHKTNYDSIIVDLGTIEIYDENGKIQKPKTKIPPVLIKKTYFVVRYNNFMQTDSDVLYHGWAEDLPPEKLKEYIEN